MQLLEKTATFLLLICIAVPYLLAMTVVIAVVELFVGAASQPKAIEAWS